MALVSPLIYWLLCFLPIVDTVDIVTQLPHLPDCGPSYALRNDLRVSATKYTLRGMRKVSKAYYDCVLEYFAGHHLNVTSYDPLMEIPEDTKALLKHEGLKSASIHKFAKDAVNSWSTRLQKVKGLAVMGCNQRENGNKRNFACVFVYF
ncbi:hypothetical protein ANCCAN_21897 [Ancylostoma caninum]|uniref:SCP domain-containing protein n=1 Tax=Ancylostoma caninum TaxID=29170 RepID=A0A368FJ84_ANCCA|nr:hypothetical protein ANCCAN_21897 [Ancylostoma caninum]